MAQLNEWFDVEAIKALTRAISVHAMGSIEALLIFRLTGFITGKIFSEGWVHETIQNAEEFVAVGVSLWLVYQLGVHLWNNRIRIEK